MPQAEADPGADRLDVFANLSVHVVTGATANNNAGKDTTTMNDLTETTEMLQARLAAQTQVADSRDALLRAAMALPNNLQYLAEGGSFASTIADLVRAIADARLAHHRTGTARLRAGDADRERWDAECTDGTRRELAYLVERLQNFAAQG